MCLRKQWHLYVSTTNMLLLVCQISQNQFQCVLPKSVTANRRAWLLARFPPSTWKMAMCDFRCTKGVGRFWENAGEITSQFVFQHGKLGPNKQLKLINRYVCLHVLISVQFTQDLQKKTIGTLHWLYPHSHLKQSVYSYSHRYDRYVFIVFSVLRIYKHIYSQLV